MAASPLSAPPGAGVLAPVRGPFRALASTIVPEAARLDEDGWRALEATVERALSRRPPAMRRQLRVLVRLLQWAPLLRRGRPFTALRERHRVSFLEGVQGSRLFPLRRGFWGLRTLVFMGYYLLPDTASALGYRAHPEGWAVRRGVEPGAAIAGGPAASHADAREGASR